jgi:hypothetical protein
MDYSGLSFNRLNNLFDPNSIDLLKRGVGPLATPGDKISKHSFGKRTLSISSKVNPQNYLPLGLLGLDN